MGIALYVLFFSTNSWTGAIRFIDQRDSMSGLLASQMARPELSGRTGAFLVSKSGKGYTIWSRRAKRNRYFSRGNNVRLLCVLLAFELPPRQ